MKKGILAILLLAGNLCVFSQINSLAEAKSIYILNFSRMIQWPPESISKGFTIGVIGDNEVYSYLTPYVKNKKVGALQIIVKKFDEPGSVSNCNILFIGNSRIKYFNDILEKVKGTNSLIITEKMGMVNSGSAIDLFQDEEKLRFVLNTANAEKYDLTVSKGLIDMAN